jgi:hypothetical protein
MTGAGRGDALTPVEEAGVDRSEALLHDVEALERNAEEAADSVVWYFMLRIVPVVVAVLVVTWLVGRRRVRRSQLPESIVIRAARET